MERFLACVREVAKSFDDRPAARKSWSDAWAQRLCTRQRYFSSGATATPANPALSKAPRTVPSAFASSTNRAAQSRVAGRSLRYSDYDTDRQHGFVEQTQTGYPRTSAD